MAIEDTKERQEELDREADDALDFGGGGIEDNRGGHDDDTVVDDDDDKEEEQVSDDDADDQEEEEEVTTEDDEESTDGDDDSDDADAEEGDGETFTLDGKKYTVEEIMTDKKLLSKMATHYNQVPHFQKIAEDHQATIAERDEQLREAEAQRQKIYNEYTENQLRKDQAERAAEQKAAEVPPAPRPSSDQLKAGLKSYLEVLKGEGRLTDDELDEHSGLISEYVYDQLQTKQLIEGIAAHFAQKIDRMERFINPAIQEWDREQAIRANAAIQTEAAGIDGYKELEDPETWQKLQEFITKKVLSSPKDSNGRPTFDPIFDAATMAEQFDAMQGKVMRAALNKKKKKVVTDKKKATKKAGGTASSGGKVPKKRPKPKKPLTEADDALDWGESKYAGG